MLRALLWDVDGTLAETERDGHRVAFNLAFRKAGLDWAWDEVRYGELLRITGGRERLLADMAARPDIPPDPQAPEVLAARLHELKNRFYVDYVRSGAVPLRPGVLELMEECLQAGVTMGIATTTSRSNVQALLAAALGQRWDSWFAVVVCGENTRRKKPDPEVYRLALQALRLPAHETLAIEDSPVGVSAARGAGVPVVVTRSIYFADDAVPGALAVGPGLGQRNGWHPAAPGDADRIGLAAVTAWHALGAREEPQPPSSTA